jgi:hypothetical protein
MSGQKTVRRELAMLGALLVLAGLSAVVLAEQAAGVPTSLLLRS